MLGIEPSLDKHLREAIAQILSVPGQVILDSVGLIESRPGYQGLGTAVCSVLCELPKTKSLFERLAEAGANVYLWPSPDLWISSSKVLRASQFRRIRTRGSPNTK